MLNRFRDKFLDSLSIDGLKNEIPLIKNKVKKIINEIAIQKKIVNEAEKEKSFYFYFDDCSDFYINEFNNESLKLSELIDRKIRLEKYYKKARFILKEKEECNII